MYALTDRDYRLPVVDEEHEIVATKQTNAADMLGSLGLARALSDARPDDLTFELDASRDHVRIRLRAYRCKA
jgi:hypothetical protein